jgi:hypothetical protein
LGGRLDTFRRPGRYDVAFKLDANQWNGTVAPQLVVKRIYETPDRFVMLRARLAEEWTAGPAAWSDEAKQIFGELGLLDEPGRWRPLVESETFRDLLAREEAGHRLARAA